MIMKKLYHTMKMKMKTFKEFLTEDSNTKHLAYLNGYETHARKVGGKWLVGGDVVSKGDQAFVAAKEFVSKRLAWHHLKGNRLIFDDFLTDKEIEKHNSLNEH